jgi:trans-aconitate methyltransferase
MMKDKIKRAYKSTRHIYDDTLTANTWWARLYIRMFWGGVDDAAIAAKVLSFIPQGFTGELLDVPAGTALFTYEKYRKIPDAHIFCLDYSPDMLEKARQRLGGSA